MTGFTEVSRTTRFTGVVISVDEVDYTAPDGSTITREVVEHMGAVVVVPFDGENVYLIRQFRAAVGQDLLELPAGKRDVPGEPPEETARRECIEEVGMEPASIDLLQTFWNSPGFCTEYSYLYLARELTPRPVNPQGVEEVAAEIVSMPASEAIALAASGEITDAKTLIGLYALEHWLDRR